MAALAMAIALPASKRSNRRVLVDEEPFVCLEILAERVGTFSKVFRGGTDRFRPRAPFLYLVPGITVGNCDRRTHFYP